MIRCGVIVKSKNDVDKIKELLSKFSKQYQVEIEIKMNDYDLMITDNEGDEPGDVIWCQQTEREFFDEVFQRISRILRVSKHVLISKSNNTIIEKSRIISIESYGRKTRVKEKRESIMTSFKMNYWRINLDPYMFVECHRGVIVNVAEIYKIHRDVVYLKNGSILPVSRRRKKQLKDSLIVYEYKKKGQNY